MEMFIKLKQKTKSVKTKFNLGNGLLSILMEPTRKRMKQNVKEGQCLNMDGKLFKTTYQQRKENIQKKT
jgi:hypothetical protein